MSDERLRKLERAARNGDPTALALYIAGCRRVAIRPEHGLACLHIRNTIRAVDPLGEVSFNQLGFWVIEALATDVALYTDCDFQDYCAEDKTDIQEWFVLPTQEELTILKEQHRNPFFRNEPWSPALLLQYTEESNQDPRIHVIPPEWDLPRAGLLKVDTKNTYSDIILRASNPPHMCYGNCYCQACIIHGCCSYED